MYSNNRSLFLVTRVCVLTLQLAHKSERLCEEFGVCVFIATFLRHTLRGNVQNEIGNRWGCSDKDIQYYV